MLRVLDDGSLLVRAPRRTAIAYIDKFVTEHMTWIEKKRALVLERKQNHPLKSNEELTRQIQKSYDILLPKIKRYAALMGVTPTAIRITKAEKRFGSCSSKKHLCFSYRLIEYPDPAIDYVIVHELAHLRELNHGTRFWAVVASILPDYKSRQKMLLK